MVGGFRPSWGDVAWREGDPGVLSILTTLTCWFVQRPGSTRPRRAMIRVLKAGNIAVVVVMDDDAANAGEHRCRLRPRSGSRFSWKYATDPAEASPASPPPHNQPCSASARPVTEPVCRTTSSRRCAWLLTNQGRMFQPGPGDHKPPKRSGGVQQQCPAGRGQSFRSSVRRMMDIKALLLDHR